MATALIGAGAALLAIGLALAYRNTRVEAIPPSPVTSAAPARINAARRTPTPWPMPEPPTATPAPAAEMATPPPPTPAPVPTPTPPGPPANAPPDRIVIPAIGLDAPVVPVGWELTEEGLVWQVADYAVGWHDTSAYPGHEGNIVLSGHHNIKGQVFRYLINLEPGDEVILYVGETAYRYLVAEKHLLEEKGMPEEVRRRNARWITATEDERLTLVTCWPYTSNTHRLIVVARPLREPRAEGRGPEASFRNLIEE